MMTYGFIGTGNMGAALARAAGIVVHDAEGLEDLGGAVVHLYRNGEMQLLTGLTQQLAGGLVQLQIVCYMVELGLSVYIRIVSLVCHNESPNMMDFKYRKFPLLQFHFAGIALFAGKNAVLGPGLMGKNCT